MKKHRLFGIGLIIALGLLIGGCGGNDEDVVSSRAYTGHTTENDTLNFVKQYPDTVGTRLDDCQTCHTSGTITTATGSSFKNACDFCHLIEYPLSDTTAVGAPSTYADTLNPYGAAYLQNGRDQDAIKTIGDLDSDGDGAFNKNEIAALRYPGDASSNPSQQVAAVRIVSLDEIKAMPSHTEFLLCNTTKQQFDTYDTYTGVKILDLLTDLGIDLTQATGITVIAPDGFKTDFDIADITAAYPPGQYYSGLDVATLGSECGFVEYPSTIPSGITGTVIPDEQWLMLGYERERAPLEASYLDPAAGKIGGEGPFRIVVPQDPAGSPDRGSKFSPTTCNDGYDYDRNKSHNAGDMVKGVIAIRINPMPAGIEEFDYMNGGWAYIDAEQVVVYGFGIN